MENGGWPAVQGVVREVSRPTGSKTLSRMCWEIWATLSDFIDSSGSLPHVHVPASTSATQGRVPLRAIFRGKDREACVAGTECGRQRCTVVALLSPWPAHTL